MHIDLNNFYFQIFARLIKNNKIKGKARQNAFEI
jgi:hypothetical protein